MDELLILATGDLELALAPGVGGCVASFERRTPDRTVMLLRGERRVPERVLDAASFPLVPYVNRIRGGRFSFDGRDIELAPNMAGDPNPLHGQGWLSSWDVIKRMGTTAALRFVHSAGEWPWDYEAVQHVALDPFGVTMVLSCTNRSDRPMPCGLGHHPCFPCTGETRLDTEVRWAWTIDAQVLPVEKVRAEGHYDLADRAICGQGLDNGFGAWSGRARIATPGDNFAVEMSSPDARFLQLHSPEQGDFFVAEPVSHANSALNAAEPEWPALGLQILSPGETMRLAMRIEVVPA